MKIMNLQANLNLCWAHVYEGTFSDLETHKVNFSFNAKFQTTFVICFFLFLSYFELSFVKKFICKVERLNIKQCRSR